MTKQQSFGLDAGQLCTAIRRGETKAAVAVGYCGIVNMHTANWGGEMNEKLPYGCLSKTWLVSVGKACSWGMTEALLLVLGCHGVAAKMGATTGAGGLNTCLETLSSTRIMQAGQMQRLLSVIDGVDLFQAICSSKIFDRNTSPLSLLILCTLAKT